MAAASISASLIASRRLQSVGGSGRVEPSGSTCTSVPSFMRLTTIVLSSLMYRRFPCRYDSYPVAAFSVNDSQEPTFNHSHDDETRFAIMQIEIGLFDRKCILEDTARRGPNFSSAKPPASIRERAWPHLQLEHLGMG
jgi:hypothetical protein